MEDSKAFTMKIKANDGTYNTLFPESVRRQVIDWGLGEIYGPYVFVLRADSWSNNTQTVQVPYILPSDYPICMKVLKGSLEEMKKQNDAYALLTSNGGIQSREDSIVFTCSSEPEIDFEVQVWWSR